MSNICLVISARKDGYSISQTPATMTVGELKEYLNRYSDDIEVYISNDNGFTYGAIKETRISEECPE